MPEENKKAETDVKKRVEESIGKIKDKEEILGEGKEYKKERKREIDGMAYVYTSFNNTILHITDMAGNTISRISGGMMTKHDRLKANPTVAMFVAKRAAEQAKDVGITSLYVRIKAKTGSPAPGPGAHAIVRSLSREGIKIISIADTTKVPRGGPKKKGGRRGRRV
ncbi:MAG TPA: 30S ribosomal protein S11 [Candidatus Paceibacterota bacterium]|nr:30S ribosomal protein S11 [Candidatus Paceibacterota bacterium]